MSAVNYAVLLRESHARLMSSEARAATFLADFYRLLLARSPVIAERFRNTDMKRQQTMIRRSLMHVLAFAVSMSADDYLEGIARRHGRADLDITPDLYDAWTEALVQAARLNDPDWSRDSETAWRVGMAPGIEFMRSRYGA